jgi:hypothetical protein
MSASKLSRVVRFHPAQANCLWRGGPRYFLLEEGSEAPAMAGARCPHRGGPLHLGATSMDRRRIVCPMHGLGTPVAALRRAALPTVVRSDEIVVLVPAEEAAAEPFNSRTGRRRGTP